ncbi:MAG: amidohydrolase family protein [Alphaproteobacteria bacterium]|nr:amidohydrolase family protein [Alphaproteobacteria bacterium]
MATLFQGGLVFDGKDQLLRDHGVVIEDGRITAFAPVAEFGGFSGEIIDTTGGTLIPGMGDCHVHLCYEGAADPFASMSKKSDAAVAMTVLENAQTDLRAGLTMLRDCGGKDYIEFAVRDAIRNGTFVGPTILAAGKMICMTGGHGNRIGRVADGEDEVKKAVREQIHAGCDLIKIMATGGVMTPGVNPEDAHYSAEEIAAGIHEAKRFHKRSASHAQGTEGILNAVRGGITSIEHGIFMSEKCIEEMVESGVYLVPTIAALRNILANKDRGVPAFAVEKTERVSEAHQASFRAYHAAGGKIAMGTDAGTPFNRHGENLQELAYMMEYGLSATEALATAMRNAADLMGLDDHGVIAKGAVADLVIVEGDPTVDIQAVVNKASHRAVYKGGRLISVDPVRAGLAIAAE